MTLAPAQVAKIRELRAAGTGYGRIAKQLGISTSTARSYSRDIAVDATSAEPGKDRVIDSSSIGKLAAVDVIPPESLPGDRTDELEVEQPRNAVDGEAGLPSMTREIIAAPVYLRAVFDWLRSNLGLEIDFGPWLLECCFLYLEEHGISLAVVVADPTGREAIRHLAPGSGAEVIEELVGAGRGT